MKESFKQRWIKALTDGSYKQTSGVLRDETGHCCLGVACDLIAPAQWKTPDTVSYQSAEGQSIEKLAYSWDDTNATGLERLAIIFGLERSQVKMLAEMNDHGKDFKAIAGRLESIPTNDHGAD